MPKNYKLQILWSRRTSPGCIDHMLQDERINCLIETGRFRCRIGSLTGGFKDDLGKTLIVPMEPHGIISDIYVDNGKWYGDVIIPEVGANWIEMVDIMKEPVIHPFMIGNDATGEYRLIHFGILEKSMLDPNCVYDGIHYDVPNHFDGDTINVLGIKEGECKKKEDIPDEIRDIIMKFKSKISQPSEKLFRIEISDDQNHYEHFGISIIVKAGNINHAYMKFWKDIINDKHIDFSDAEADPLFENDHFSNWVIDSSDDKHTTYKRPDKHFKIRVEELDMSKGYALVGDWST